MTSGMVKTCVDVPMDNLQPIPTGSSEPRGAAQRLNDGGPHGLRYSLLTVRKDGALMLLR
jgi:hypothetical protein